MNADINISNVSLADAEMLNAEIDTDKITPRQWVALQMWVASNAAQPAFNFAVEPELFNDSKVDLDDSPDTDRLLDTLIDTQEQMAKLSARRAELDVEIQKAFNEYHSWKSRFENYRETEEWFFMSKKDQADLWNKYKTGRDNRWKRAQWFINEKKRLSVQWWNLQHLANEYAEENSLWQTYFKLANSKMLPYFVSGNTAEIDAMDSLFLSPWEQMESLSKEKDDLVEELFS